jgi:hypothetical protein
MLPNIFVLNLSQPGTGWQRMKVDACEGVCCVDGGFTITPLKQRGGSQVRARVQHLVQIDLRGWGANYIPACHNSSVTQMLNSVAGKLLWLSSSVKSYQEATMHGGLVMLE